VPHKGTEKSQSQRSSRRHSNVEGEAKRQRRNLETRLRVLDRMSREGDALLVLMSGEDTGQILRMTWYLKDIVSPGPSRIIMRFKDTMDILAVKQSITRRSSLHAWRSRKGSSQSSKVSFGRRRRSARCSSRCVRKEKSAYERMIAELREASKRLSRIIEEFREEGNGTQEAGDAGPCPCEEPERQRFAASGEA